MRELVRPAARIDVPVEGKIIGIRRLTAREKVFRIELPGGARLAHQPGQFVMVGLYGSGEAPISITSPPSPGESFELCVRAAGALTHRLHSMEEGDVVGIRGPFGRGFPVREMEGYDMLFVAGGLGLAPLRSLIRYVLERRDRFGSVTILYGARTPADRLFLDELAQWEGDRSIDFRQSIDVGEGDWTGRVGVITTLFRGMELKPARTMVAVCGPPVMYRFVLIELLARGFLESRIYLSFERRMCCGLGKCGRCQINGEFVCRSGPVYSYLHAGRLREAL